MFLPGTLGLEARGTAAPQQNSILLWAVLRPPLHLEQPERRLYLAAPLEVYVGQIEDEKIILDTLQNHHISLILFATDQPKIKRWIK